MNEKFVFDDMNISPPGGFERREWEQTIYINPFQNRPITYIAKVKMIDYNPNFPNCFFYLDGNIDPTKRAVFNADNGQLESSLFNSKRLKGSLRVLVADGFGPQGEVPYFTFEIIPQDIGILNWLRSRVFYPVWKFLGQKWP